MKPSDLHQQKSEMQCLGHKNGPHNASAASRNSVHKGYHQNRWHKAALAESNFHCKWNRLTDSNADQTLSSVIQGPNSPCQGVWHTLLAKQCPYNSLRSLLETCRLIGLACILEDPAEGVEQFQCSTARTKNTLLLPKNLFPKGHPARGIAPQPT